MKEGSHLMTRMAHVTEQEIVLREDYTLSQTTILPDMLGAGRGGMEDHEQVGAHTALATMTAVSQKRGSPSSFVEVKDVKKCKSKSLQFVCCAPSCGEKFSSNEHLNTHMRLHMGVKPFTCEVCGKVCQTESKLKTHEASHASDGIKPMCDICKRNFSSRSALNKHKKMLHKPKPHICPYCEYGFEAQKYLAIHAKRAHGIDFPSEAENSQFSSLSVSTSKADPELSSNDCKNVLKGISSRQDENLTYTTLTNISVDIKDRVCTPSHSQDCVVFNKKTDTVSQSMCVSISCALCTSTFPSVAYLDQHMAVHKGEKSLTCSRCKASFTSNQDLTLHTRLHTPTNENENSLLRNYRSENVNLGEYNVIQCGQMKTAQTPSKYVCVICEEQFINLGSLKRHQAKAHVSST